MNPERFSELALRISPLVDSEIARLRSLQKWKEALPPWRTIWEIVRMISFRIESELQKWNQFIPEYHVPWMTQALLKKWTTEKDLRLDTESQVFYENVQDMKIPISGIDIFDSAFSEIPDALIFRWFVKNMDQICVLLKQLLDWVMHDKEKDILILSNHATWFNLPLLAHCLHRIFGIPKDHIYTIFGPAITHSQFNRAGILKYSNWSKTVPDTDKAKTWSTQVKSIRIGFLKNTISIVQNENPSNFPRVFLLAPSGTTDIQNPDGTLSLVRPSIVTQKLIQEVFSDKLWLEVFCIWVNDLDVLPSWRSRPKWFWGDVFVRGVLVDANNWQEHFPQQIVDQHGHPIGKWKDENPSN